ncbi:MAG: KEOPS complex kinase/ATPase Bud32 [Thaumarchaeota archaeon]|nr:KEOPS complex kinase/ATPase Bud32 [Nitrososphaerota archaeon]
MEGCQTKLIHRGAEADLLLGRWCGLESIYKSRKPLTYRLKVLDDAVRTRRTAHEALMLREAKRVGVRTPYLYHVDTKGAVIIMEYLKGARLKDRASGMSRAGVSAVFGEVGTMVGTLHSSGIMHGDVTTSNLLETSSGLAMIDFGLSTHTQRIEDHAVDLRLIKETLTGAHPMIADLALDSIFAAYRKVVGGARLKQVKRQLSEIERRGRYARAD